VEQRATDCVRQARSRYARASRSREEPPRSQARMAAPIADSPKRTTVVDSAQVRSRATNSNLAATCSNSPRFPGSGETAAASVSHERDARPSCSSNCPSNNTHDPKGRLCGPPDHESPAVAQCVAQRRTFAAPRAALSLSLSPPLPLAESLRLRLCFRARLLFASCCASTQQPLRSQTRTSPPIAESPNRTRAR
jgi:hypothetical protein